MGRRLKDMGYEGWDLGRWVQEDGVWRDRYREKGVGNRIQGDAVWGDFTGVGTG